MTNRLDLDLDLDVAHLGPATRRESSTLQITDDMTIIS